MAGGGMDDGYPGGVMADLKDFQRDAVEYVFQRLYTDRDATRRFLVASETGLGKTLVARGVIARAIDHLRDKVDRERAHDRVDVLYICSNAGIARQNIDRLNVTGRSDFAFAGRITMLPTVVHELEDNDAERVNFISFTPRAAFDLKSSTGRKEERALLYHLLREPWDLGNRAAPKNVLRVGAGSDGFRELVRASGHYWNIDPGLRLAFSQQLERRIEAERAKGVDDIRARFERLCGAFKRHTTTPTGEVYWERVRVIGELRWELATSCLEALEPDLIILDEFQRFKHLLDGTDAASELARKLFEWGNAKTLLLSATPYKMYTLRHEAEDDDHYADFLRTLEFLEFGSAEREPLQGVLGNYRRSLFRIGLGYQDHHGSDPLAPVVRAKTRLEERLQRTMLRTEKLAATRDRDGMLVEVPPRSATLGASDLESYVSLRRVLETSVGGDAMEYWKSAPYMLNFMEGYRFKQRIGERIESATPELFDAMASSRSLLLDWKDIQNYKKIDPSNARLRALLADTVDTGTWRMLWLPPSQPYYRLEKHFQEAADTDFTKRLVFSSWRVVPKVIAGLASYEAERRMMRALTPSAKNTVEARRRRTALLTFGIDRSAASPSGSGASGSRLSQDGDKRLTGMPVLGILYPSVTLARECDPLMLGQELLTNEPGASRSHLATEGEVRALAEARITTLLGPLYESADTSAPVDEAWYWAAPILLDMRTTGETTRAWFSQWNLAETWLESDDREGEHANWTRHVQHARQLVEPDFDLRTLGRPPDDLASVLASLALGGPGICALRALERVAPGADEQVLRNSAARVSWSLRSLFNIPESMHLVRSLVGGERYWRSVLDYSAGGCLQSVLDEYVHLLKEFKGDPDRTARGVSEMLGAAIGVQAASVAVDHYSFGNAEQENPIYTDRGRLRSRFALRFGDGQSDGGDEMTRASQVREAFNSPFWPFVVATTSVGQEGLDFHPYCHAVVHWNLPSNPVDLEQREGRVHRYKNHAVRKNVAMKYGLQGMKGETTDPWDNLFDRALNERESGASDMVPYWIYPVGGGARIERHVPALPLSREKEQMDRLRRSLAAYRMVFGQARQEDLLSYLLSRFDDEYVSALAERLRIDLQPPVSSDSL